MLQEKTAPLFVQPQSAVTGCYPTSPKPTAHNRPYKRVNGSWNLADVAEKYDKR